MINFTIFLNSFLLFMLQPLIGKLLLPSFGGGSSIWITLILFFTTTLFLGYLYATVITRLKTDKQLKIHFIFICLALINLLVNLAVFGNPLLFLSSWHPMGMQYPTLELLIILLVGIGAPMILLSSTSTLLQSWYATLYPKKNPYSLYALSNAGSLLGLLSFPFVWEPLLPLHIQQYFIAFLVLVISMLLLTVMKIVVQRKVLAIPRPAPTAQLNPFQIAKSVLYAAISSLMLLVTINTLSGQLPPFPLLIMVPLVLYLLSFIITFFSVTWYNRLFHSTLLLGLLVISSTIVSGYVSLPFWLSIVTVLLTQFLANSIFHAELYLLRPETAHLPVYYLGIAFGGMFGTFCVAIIAPAVFSGFWEYSITLVILAVLSVISLCNAQKPNKHLVQFITVGAIACIAIIVVSFQDMFIRNENIRITRSRNFYGSLRIVEKLQNNILVERDLYHGTTLHGTQRLNSENRFTPTAYYTTDSGLGLSINNHPNRQKGQPINVGIIGLGVGTIASYCQPGDTFRFYEINPEIIRISKKYFSYLAHCADIGGKVEIVEGDARVELEKENGRRAIQLFDILVVDAFIDDTIPTHLITHEAMGMYESRLTDTGVVAIHISNRHLNLAPILAQTASPLGLNMYTYYSPTSIWFLLSKRPLLFAPPTPVEFYEHVSAWTDNYSNILDAIR